MFLISITILIYVTHFEDVPSYCYIISHHRCDFISSLSSNPFVSGKRPNTKTKWPTLLHIVLYKGFQNCAFIVERAQHLPRVYWYDFTWYVLVNTHVCILTCRCVCLWSPLCEFMCVHYKWPSFFGVHVSTYVSFFRIFSKLMTLPRRDFIWHDVLLHSFCVIISVSFPYFEKCTSLTHFIYLNLAGVAVDIAHL